MIKFFKLPLALFLGLGINAVVFSGSCPHNAAVTLSCVPQQGAILCSNYPATSGYACAGKPGWLPHVNSFYCSLPGSNSGTYCSVYSRYPGGPLVQAVCAQQYRCELRVYVPNGQDPGNPANWIWRCEPDTSWPLGAPTYAPLTLTILCPGGGSGGGGTTVPPDTPF
jgi:hypothetical protein